MPTVSNIETTLYFAAMFGLLHVIFTIRVGLYRASNQISLGDGGDKVLLKRIRAHGNFTENVPIALVLLLLNELNGLGEQSLLILGGLFLLARVTHYFTIVARLPLLLRPISMITTMGVILASSILLVV
ncbi:MAG: MAPEG family protein [Spongiibacteraceae bacterium]